MFDVSLFHFLHLLSQTMLREWTRVSALSMFPSLRARKISNIRLRRIWVQPDCFLISSVSSLSWSHWRLTSLNLFPKLLCSSLMFFWSSLIFSHICFYLFDPQFQTLHIWFQGLLPDDAQRHVIDLNLKLKFSTKTKTDWDIIFDCIEWNAMKTGFI